MVIQKYSLKYEVTKIKFDVKHNFENIYQTYFMNGLMYFNAKKKKEILFFCYIKRIIIYKPLNK